MPDNYSIVQDLWERPIKVATFLDEQKMASTTTIRLILSYAEELQKLDNVKNLKAYWDQTVKSALLSTRDDFVDLIAAAQLIILQCDSTTNASPEQIAKVVSEVLALANEAQGHLFWISQGIVRTLGLHFPHNYKAVSAKHMPAFDNAYRNWLAKNPS